MSAVNETQETHAYKPPLGLCATCGRTRRHHKGSEVSLEEALAESVKLQSHYAKLLNIYDGGGRIAFKDAQEYIERLRMLKENS